MGDNLFDDYVYPSKPLPPSPGSTPTKASLEKRTVQRSNSGTYALAGGGTVTYNVSNRKISLQISEDQKTSRSCCVTHWKKITGAILTVAILGIAAGVAWKLGLFDKLLDFFKDSGR